MKTNKIFSSLFMAVVMLVSAVAFTSCKDDDLDTNQYTGEINLLAYGPSPVARGGILRFIGTGMDQIKSVTLAGCDAITDIDVISSEEIHITVPQNAQPCYPVLTTKGGTEIEAKTRLTFTEPVGFAAEGSLTPNPVKPGNKLTIKGEYLNLVQTIIFADKVEVSDFEEHTREQIILTVPFEAKSDKIYLSFVATGDSIPNQILSGEVLDVVLPSVDSIVALDDKKPGDKIVINGKDLDLVEAVMSPTNDSLEFVATETSIEFDMPANITNGGIFVLPASGVSVAVATVNVALPKNLVATPDTLLRPEDVITITGENLELVTNVTFPTDGGTVDVDLEADGTATEIKVKMPAEAITGELKLNTAAKISVPVKYYTKKPVLGEFNPAPVNAGDTLKIIGTDLDLIKKITFQSKLEVTEFVSQSATEIVVVVPVTTLPGDLDITMKNGEKVVFAGLQVNAPVFCYVTEWNKEDPLAGTACALGVNNIEVLEAVLLNSDTIPFMYLEGKLFIALPDAAGKKNTLTLVSNNGKVSYPFIIKPNTEQTYLLWQGMFSNASWSANHEFGKAADEDKEMFKALPLQAGDIVRIWATVTDEGWCFKFCDGKWQAIKASEWGFTENSDDAATVNSNNASLDKGYLELKITEELVTKLTSDEKLEWGMCLVFQGVGWIVTKIEVVRLVDLEQELAVGPFIADAWGAQPTVLNNGELNEASAGQILKFYMTPLKAGWCLQLFDSSWGYLNMEFKDDDTAATYYDLAAHDGAIEVTLTDALINSMKNGVILNGDGCKITSIGLK